MKIRGRNTFNENHMKKALLFGFQIASNAAENARQHWLIQDISARDGVPKGPRFPPKINQFKHNFDPSIATFFEGGIERLPSLSLFHAVLTES